MECLCRFSTADHIVVWSARTWSTGRSEWYRVEKELSGPFGAETGQSLSRNLHTLFYLIGGAATRQFLVAPMKCAKISEDEQLLVGALAEAQRKNWPLAVACFEDFLPQTCIRHIFEPAASIAAILDRAGYKFTQQPQLLAHGALDAYRRGSGRAQPIASH